MKKGIKLCAMLTIMLLLASSTPVFAAGSKVNVVGLNKQEYSYSCGAAAARNAALGFWQVNKYTLISMNENSFRLALGTTTNGTDFNANKWQTLLNGACPGNNYTLKWGSGWGGQTMGNCIMHTINKAKNYNVVANINHGTTSTNYIHSSYARGAAHYICIYGYDDNSKRFNISDSKVGIAQTYTCTYGNAAWSTSSRGIIY